MLKLYNTLTRKKEVFKPIKKGQVGIYSCGLTVYNYGHIGNLRTYIFSDILKRVLIYNNYNVKQVMNVTDVGHLTSDSDEGEDKIEKAAKKEGKKAQDIADFYLKIFKQDFKKLNISEPNIWCKATKHIKEQIDRHLQKAAERLFNYFKAHKFDQLVICASKDILLQFEKKLHPYLRKRLIKKISKDFLDDIRKDPKNLLSYINIEY